MGLKHRDILQTIIVIVLMCTSLFLTYQILSFQRENEIDKMTTVSNTVLGDDKALKDIVVPLKIMSSVKNNFFLSSNEDDYLTLYEALEEAKIITGESTVYDDLISKKDSVLLIQFPQMTIGDFQQVVNPTRDLKNKYQLDFAFDYVLIDMEQVADGEAIVTFADEQTKQRVITTIENVDTLKVKRLYQQIKEMNFKYNRYELENKQSVFLQSERTEMDHLTFLAEDYDKNRLKNVFFKTDAKVTMSTLDKNTLFTDGNAILTIYPEDKIFKYAIKNIMSSKIPIDTFRQINSHVNFVNKYGGWKDDFVYDGVKYDMATYRLRMNQYPVFSQDGESKISLTYTQSGFQQYIRPNFAFKGIILSEVFKVNIPSGEEVMDTLKTFDTIDFTDIEDVFLGYQMYVQSENQGTKIIRFEPSWFVKIDGKTKSLEDIDGQSFQ